MRLALSTVLALIAVVAAWAQPSSRPKLGVALGGGGALGFSHVGVLAWMEEHRIPIDYIAGTSMGALVGGFYATGKSPAEMQKLVRDIQWDQIFRGNPQFKNLRYRRKEDRRAFPNPLEFGLREGFRTRRGVTAGQDLGLLLDRVLLTYSDELDFDQLPTPFRCVATDLITADPIVLRRGSLISSLRASIAIPGVFTPVEQDGKVLIDGGLSENLPTGVVKAMGADVVLGVVLPAAQIEEQDLGSLAGVLARSVSVAIIQNERRSVALANLTVRPDIKQYGNFSYQAADDLIKLGYEAAERSSAELMKYAVSEDEWRAWQQQRQARSRAKVPVPQFVEVKGGKPETEARIKQKLTGQLGKPLEPENVEQVLTDIQGTGRFEASTYSIRERNGEAGIQVDLQQKVYGPPFLYAAIDVNGEDPRNVTFSFRTRLVVLDLGGYDSELRTTIGVGQQSLLETEYLRRIAGTSWFVAPRGGYRRDLTNIFLDGTGRAEYTIERANVALEGGRLFNRVGEARAGVEIGHLRTRLRIGSPAYTNIDGSYKAFNVRLAYDNQDSPQVPTHGARVVWNGQYYFDGPLPKSFPATNLEASYFHSLSEQNLLFVLGGGGSSFGSRLPLPLQYTLGRPLALGALRVDELRGDRFVYVTTGYLRRVGQIPQLLGDNVYLGGWYSLGGIPSEDRNKTFFNNLTLGLVAETSLGPFFLGASFGEGGRRQVSFRLGRFF